MGTGTGISPEMHQLQCFEKCVLCIIVYSPAVDSEKRVLLAVLSTLYMDPNMDPFANFGNHNFCNFWTTKTWNLYFYPWSANICIIIIWPQYNIHVIYYNNKFAFFSPGIIHFLYTIFRRTLQKRIVIIVVTYYIILIYFE